MKASERQVGGNHYKSEYQHWDWAIDIRLGYLESAASKYITRWRGKNGVQDVEKAIHYLEKALEANREGRLHNWSHTQNANYEMATLANHKTIKFINLNCETKPEHEFMLLLSKWTDANSLIQCIEIAKLILDMAQAAQGKAGATPASTPQSPSSGLKPAPLTLNNPLPPVPKAPPPLSGSTNHPSPFGYEGDD